MKSFQTFISFLPFRAGMVFGLLTGSLLLLGSCVQESFVADEDNAPVEILLNGGVGDLAASGSTRVVVDDDYVTKTDLPVSMIRIDQDANSTWPTYKIGGQLLDATRVKGMGQTAINFATRQFYLARSGNNGTKMWGYYPRIGTPGVTFDEEKEEAWFDLTSGALDAMHAKAITADKNSQFGTSDKQFTFTHRLKQFTVKAYGDATAAATWGVIQSIKAVNICSRCAVDHNGGITLSGSKISVLLRYPGTDAAMSNSIAIPNGAANQVTCGYILALPDNVSVLELDVTTSLGGTRRVNVGVPAGGASFFDLGKSYTVELQFTSKGIVPASTIGAWTNGGDVTGDIEV